MRVLDVGVSNLVDSGLKRRAKEIKMIVAQSIASSLDVVDRGARVILRGVVVIGVD
jgi:hypothetical protein